jgi:tRNA-dihydrouridine synthase B
VNVPVIANGDIIDVQTATKAMELSGADGVMVGRGAQGRPWQLAQIASTLFGTPVPQIPTGAQLLNMISGHYEAMLSFYGDPLGNRVARKHLGWYMDTLPTPPDLRKRIFTEKDSAKVLHLIRELPASGLQMAAQ